MIYFTIRLYLYDLRPNTFPGMVNVEQLSPCIIGFSSDIIVFFLGSQLFPNFFNVGHNAVR